MIKHYIFKVRDSKQPEHIAKQVKNVVNRIMNKHNDANGINIYLGYSNDDFIKDKKTLKITVNL